METAGGAGAAGPGRPHPLGAHARDGGVNFAVFSEVADRIDVCLFDPDGTEHRIPLPECDAGVWHGFVPGIGPGARYGFRTAGPYAPERGIRCNPHKLLLDPYARAIDGSVQHGPAVLDYDVDDHGRASELDSAASVPRSVVVEPQPVAIPEHTPWRRGYADTVLYELHVKGFTQLHPAVPPELRGTYAGLGHDAVLEYLCDLGVTAVELLPVHELVPERPLVERGLTNYWGYNPIGYFAPHGAYSAAARTGQVGGQVSEFRAMVDRFHDAGIEVILDVVFNHTAEGDETGPTLCHRGLDNAAYYRLNPRDRSKYVDTTGTGNALNVAHPRTLQMIMDSLRYWITVMGVDGFRFDLASTLARDHGPFDPGAAFFDLVAQDPIVSRVKCIAEPWDVGQPDSYGIGRFPAGWAEWNGRYRDCVRDFWRGVPGLAGEFATRITGSSDLYGTARRGPTASVNFITAHDGFTLRDLTSYEHKHNDANGEHNRDGTDDNRSWNGGVEGPTDDPVILARRATQVRTFLATLCCSFGVPMLVAGDELGRTQLGNNNAYCQDNEISWIDWYAIDHELLEFTRRLLQLRRAHPVFRPRRFVPGTETQELAWFATDGSPMTVAEWSDPNTRAFTLFLDGERAPDRAPDGSLLIDHGFLLVVNAWWEPLDVTVPVVGTDRPRHWRRVFSSADGFADTPDTRDAQDGRVSAGAALHCAPRSVTLLVDPQLGPPESRLPASE